MGRTRSKETLVDIGTTQERDMAIPLPKKWCWCSHTRQLFPRKCNNYYREHNLHAVSTKLRTMNTSENQKNTPGTAGGPGGVGKQIFAHGRFPKVGEK